MNKISLTLLLYLLLHVALHASNLQPFPLSSVRLLNSEFKNAEKLDAEYIMAHDPDRLLAPFLIDAGLTPKAERYGNWENTGLDGHICGHYLTALAQLYAGTGEQRFIDRLNYMIDELERCQLKNGNGYVGGIPGGNAMWKDIASGKIDAGAFSLNGKWVPLYNIHKTFAGLRDAYQIAGIEKAKGMLIALTDFFLEISKNLSDDQIQEMLRSEHGGMNEVFADVYAITDEGKYLELAIRYSHNIILNPLLENEDRLNGLHANTQIPKVIGFERIAELDHNKAWHNAATFFWNTVVDHRSVSIGGNSVREHFHPANNFSSMMESKEGPETCNTYNMIKLTKDLYFADGDLKYIDYYERALYNHILSTEHPEHGGFVYFTPMRPRHYRVYSNAGESFWCCVGSGMENHGKYGELIYAHNEADLFVNLFIPSELTWKEKGLVLLQENNFPDEAKTSFTLNLKKSQKFDLNIRYPEWVKADAMEVWVNGQKYDYNTQPGSYFSISRKWKDDDRIEVKIPMHMKLEQLPDKSDFVSIEYGPIVLGAITDTTDLDGLIADGSRMGHIANGPLYPLEDAPSFIVNKISEIKPKRLKSDQLVFDMPKSIYPQKYSSLKLIPFYRIYDARYEVYFPFSTPEQFAEKQSKIKKQENERLVLESKTIDKVAPGEQQPESDHNFKAERSQSGVHRDRHWRTARGWFSYELKDPKQEAKILRVTYFGADRNRKFDILLNNENITSVTLDGSKGEQFYTVDYAIPGFITVGSNGFIELKFVAHENSTAGGIYGVRLMR